MLDILKAGRFRFWLLLITVALVVVLIPISFSKADSDLSKGCTEKVTAVVVESVEKHYDARGRGGPITMIYPIYQFEYNGKTYKVASGICRSELKYPVNTTVQLMVDPNCPTHIYNPQDEDTVAESNTAFTLIFLAAVVSIGAFAFGIKKVLGQSVPM